MAVRDEIIHSNPFDLVVFRRVKVERVFLTEKELKKLIKYYDMQMFSNTLHRTLRHFLFMCLTGLRISDFMRIRKDNVQENALKFVPYKTRVKKPVQITVPLVEKAKQLIRDENSLFPEVFVTIPEQKYNDQLKDIADMAGINKEITNHSARHTFATLFLEKTNDVATLQKILGHSNIRETMVYVHISTKKITAQMQCFDRLLELQ
jgi:integrase